MTQPIAGAIRLDGVAVVQKAIEDRGGQCFVARQHGRPFGNALVRGDNCARPLIAVVHDLEQPVHVAPVERLESEFVDDEQLGAEITRSTDIAGGRLLDPAHPFNQIIGRRFQAAPAARPSLSGG